MPPHASFSAPGASHRVACTITPRDWGVAVAAMAVQSSHEHAAPRDAVSTAADGLLRAQGGFVRGLLSLVFGRDRVKRAGAAYERAGMGLVERTFVKEAVGRIEKGAIDVPLGPVTITMDASGARARWQGRERSIAWGPGAQVERVDLGAGPALLLCPRPLRSVRDLDAALLVPLEGIDDPEALASDAARWCAGG